MAGVISEEIEMLSTFLAWGGVGGASRSVRYKVVRWHVNTKLMCKCMFADHPGGHVTLNCYRCVCRLPIQTERLVNLSSARLSDGMLH